MNVQPPERGTVQPHPSFSERPSPKKKPDTLETRALRWDQFFDDIMREGKDAVIARCEKSPATLPYIKQTLEAERRKLPQVQRKEFIRFYTDILRQFETPKRRETKKAPQREQKEGDVAPAVLRAVKKASALAKESETKEMESFKKNQTDLAKYIQERDSLPTWKFWNKEVQRRNKELEQEIMILEVKIQSKKDRIVREKILPIIEATSQLPSKSSEARLRDLSHRLKQIPRWQIWKMSERTQLKTEMQEIKNQLVRQTVIEAIRGLK